MSLLHANEEPSCFDHVIKLHKKNCKSKNTEKMLLLLIRKSQLSSTDQFHETINIIQLDDTQIAHLLCACARSEWTDPSI